MTTKLKTYLFEEGKPPIHYREGTSDEWIINACMVTRKDYLLPAFTPKVVFDIGANIGVVSVILANIYPTAKIYAFEPIEDNYRLLKRNTFPYPNVMAIKCGLGEFNGKANIYPSVDNKNHGGFSAHIKNGPGETIEIRSVRDFCNELGTPELIKIDCEGAEYEILKSIPDIGKVKWIAGELHGINEYLLLDRLSQNFFIKASRDFGDKVWNFYAVSKSWPHLSLDPALQP